jgi:hypothetical protein
MSEATQEEGRAHAGCLPEETRQHLRAARREMRASFQALMPPAFVEHRRTARREFLLAARSIIDHALDRMEAEGTSQG